MRSILRPSRSYSPRSTRPRISNDAIVGALDRAGMPLTTIEVAACLPEGAIALLLTSRLSKLADGGLIRREYCYRTYTAADGFDMRVRYCLWSSINSLPSSPPNDMEKLVRPGHAHSLPRPDRLSRQAEKPVANRSY